MKVKAKCARALIRYLKEKESERENCIMQLADSVSVAKINQWQLHYPFAEQASLCFEREKKAYIAGLGRDQLEHLASPRQVRDDRKTSRDRTRVLQP